MDYPYMELFIIFALRLRAIQPGHLNYLFMKSTLKIDVGSFNTPIIHASVSHDLSDLRDKVMNSFFNSLDGSFLCFANCYGTETSSTAIGGNASLYTIDAIPSGKEEVFMNRLSLPQAKRIIHSLFQTVPLREIENMLMIDDTGRLRGIISSDLLEDFQTKE